MYGFQWNRAVAGYDRTHVFQAGWVYELPVGKGKAYVNSGTACPHLGELEGERHSLGVYGRSVQRYRLWDIGGCGPDNTQTADQVKTNVQQIGGIGSGQPYFDPTAFAAVTAVRFGTSGRNVLRGPGIFNFDLSLFRDFPIKERLHLEFRTDCFNVTNTAKFSNPAANAEQSGLFYADYEHTLQQHRAEYRTSIPLRPTHGVLSLVGGPPGPRRTSSSGLLEFGGPCYNPKDPQGPPSPMWLCFLALAAAQINPQALYERGQRDAALSQQAFEKLLKIAPESAYVLALLGEVKTQDRQYTAALYAYTEAAKRMPAMRGVRAKSAEIYDSLGKPTEAAAARAAEQKLGPVNCASEKLQCDFDAGRFEEVVKTAQTRNNAEGFYWLSRAYNELAEQSFAELGKLPESPELHRVKAQILSDHGQFREAVEEWRIVLKFSPDDRDAQHQLATALYQSHDAKPCFPNSSNSSTPNPIPPT